VGKKKEKKEKSISSNISESLSFPFAIN